MRHRLVHILALMFIIKLSYSQIIDRYGINLGISYSTQFWDYKLVDSRRDNLYKFGFQAFIQAEKDFGDLLAFRTEFGYIQKGFKVKFKPDLPHIISVGSNYDYVILHDLALNLGLKVKPLKTDYSPYLLVGIRGDYMISYKDIELEEAGSFRYNGHDQIIEKFNKYNLGGILGFGIDLQDVIYFEIEYNPNLTKTLDFSTLGVKDNCWGVKIGLNINTLTES